MKQILYDCSFAQADYLQNSQRPFWDLSSTNTVCRWSIGIFFFAFSSFSIPHHASVTKLDYNKITSNSKRNSTELTMRAPQTHYIYFYHIIKDIFSSDLILSYSFCIPFQWRVSPCTITTLPGWLQVTHFLDKFSYPFIADGRDQILSTIKLIIMQGLVLGGVTENTASWRLFGSNPGYSH